MTTSSRHKCCPFSNQTGFTLVELVLVALLLAVMSSIVYGTLSGIIRTRNSVEDLRGGERALRSVFSKLTREFASAMLVPLNTDNSNNSSQFSRRAYFLAENDTLGRADADRVTFVASTGGEPVAGATQNYGPVEVSYYLKEAPTEEQERGNYTRYALVREEKPADVSKEEILSKRTVRFPLATNLLSFNLRFLKEEQWQDDWSGNDSVTLPLAVEISVVFDAGNQTPRLYKTAIAIPAARKPKK